MGGATLQSLPPRIPAILARAADSDTTHIVLQLGAEVKIQFATLFSDRTEWPRQHLSYKLSASPLAGLLLPRRFNDVASLFHRVCHPDRGIMHWLLGVFRSMEVSIFARYGSIDLRLRN